MQASFDGIEYLVGNSDVLEKIIDVPVMPIFSDIVIDFLSDLSKAIITDKSIRAYKDIMGYAYWIRKASLIKEKNNIVRAENKIGRGVCFHIAPSNIPVQFAISMVSALLAGNANIIRCSSKDFEQTNIICKKINELLCSEYEALKPFICIIRYGHDDELTSYFSSVCDVRVIWGGDQTVSHIKSFPTQPRSIDISFSDRYSLGLFNSRKVIEGDVEKLVNDFWIDTYYVDQNACSSPRMIIWTRDGAEEARKQFWSSLDAKAKEEYELQPIQAVNKLTSYCRLSMRESGIKKHGTDNYVVRAEVQELIPEVMKYKDSGGYFFEYICDDIEEIVPLLKKKECQTIGVYGFDSNDIKKIVFKNGCKGVDRIVSIGNTTAPGLDWDGYVLVDNMSRYLEVE